MEMDSDCVLHPLHQQRGMQSSSLSDYHLQALQFTSEHFHIDSLISRIKDRHRACPVNCIVHPTSILYGIRIIISLVMHSNNSQNRQRLLLGIQQSPAYLKLEGFTLSSLEWNVRTNSGKESICAKYILEEDREIMRVLFGTKIFYHSTSIFAIVSSPFHSYI